MNECIITKGIFFQNLYVNFHLQIVVGPGEKMQQYLAWYSQVWELLYIHKIQFQY